MFSYLLFLVASHSLSFFFFASFFLFFFNYYLQCTIKVTLTCRFKRHSEHGVVSLEYHAVSRLIGISLSP